MIARVRLSCRSSRCVAAERVRHKTPCSSPWCDRCGRDEPTLRLRICSEHAEADEVVAREIEECDDEVRECDAADEYASSATVRPMLRGTVTTPTTLCKTATSPWEVRSDTGLN